MSFWDDFLAHRRYQLIPWQMQTMWNSIAPQVPDDHYQVYQVEHFLLPGEYIPRDVLEMLMRGVLPPRYAYRHFAIPKRDGSRRELAEPGVNLKAMQHNILAHFLEPRKPHPAAVGYRRGMSIADHAWAHAGAHTLITADVQDFFPSTTRYRVRQFWREYHTGQGSRNQTAPFTEDTVQLLTNLTTYRGSLPQGAPTSPALSNLVNAPLDARLAALVSQSSGRYTRYADDIVFSWQTRPRPPTDFEFTARRILREYGYRLHPRKGWAVWARHEEPEVTGVVLTRDGSVDVPRAMRRLMDELERSDDPADHLRLAGYRGYRQMIRRK